MNMRIKLDDIVVKDVFDSVDVKGDDHSSALQMAVTIIVDQTHRVISNHSEYKDGQAIFDSCEVIVQSEHHDKLQVTLEIIHEGNVISAGSMMLDKVTMDPSNPSSLSLSRGSAQFTVAVDQLPSSLTDGDVLSQEPSEPVVADVDNISSSQEMSNSKLSSGYPTSASNIISSDIASDDDNQPSNPVPANHISYEDLELESASDAPETNSMNLPAPDHDILILNASINTDNDNDDVDQESSPLRSNKKALYTRSLQQSVSEGLWPAYCNPDYIMPSYIDVKVSLAAGDYNFPVIIERQQESKMYYGGYRNKATGSIYHHASSQTPTTTNKMVRDTSALRTRETQTVGVRSLGHQTIREAGTQMDREDVLTNKKRDVVKKARRYITADQVIAEKMVKAVVIQRYWRGFMARRRANDIRQRNILRDDVIEQAKEATIRQQNQQREENVRRRLQPKTNADFEILYNELDAWRRAELVKIKISNKSQDDKAIAFASLLQEETDALQSIERLKVAAQKEIQSNKNERMLELMAQPRAWQLSSGEVAMVQTPETNRAKELLELYRYLTAPVSTVDIRLDVLLKVKWTVQVFDDSLAFDIVDLVDREADLLNRGRPFKSMEKLRIRIAHMFLEFIESPEFNPRAAEFVNVSMTVKRV